MKKLFLFALLFASCTKPVTPPTPALHVSLPLAYTIKQGETLALQARPQDGVTYQWSTGAAGPVVWVTPTANSTYYLMAVRTADSSKDFTAVNVVVQ